MKKPSTSVFASTHPFVVPSRANSLTAWAERFWQDLQSTPGRLSSTLRIVLSTVLTLIALLILQAPFASIALYFVFVVGRDSPAVSFRSIFSIAALVAAAVAELGLVILTDNDPMARILGIAAVGFIAGVLVLGTTQPALGSTWGYIFVTLMNLWETHSPANQLVKTSLWIVGAISIPILISIAVEYVFGVRHPADLLHEQSMIRWKALISMFTLFAAKAEPEERAEAATRVARLAATGQDGMQELYNKIVERNLDTGSLQIGARVRITMLAQLMDLGAAVASAPYANDTASLLHYKRIAEGAQAALKGSDEGAQTGLEFRSGPNLTILQRVEGVLHTILSMPSGTSVTKEDKQLIALPANKVPFFIPGALTDRTTIFFGLKVSLCATLCYIVYHAIDYQGLSTSVATAFLAGLSTTGAIKQRFIFRLVGAIVGGLILGLGAVTFLFPNMDSIWSLVVVIAIFAFIAGWCAQGRQFAYVGLQIAFSFFVVSIQGFSAPVELAPARDRLIGILLALIVMWFVFDQIWPVRTVIAMRHSLAVVLRNGATLFRIHESVKRHADMLKKSDALRDQVGKTVAALRTMNDSTEYEFVVEREPDIQLSQTILRAALAAAALFWNQMAFLHNKRSRDLMNEPQLVEIRQRIAAAMDGMSESVEQRKAFVALDFSSVVDSSLFADPRYAEYAQNALTRFRELQDYVQQIGLTENR
jgi:multidrug resistance protein MdtO